MAGLLSGNLDPTALDFVGGLAAGYGGQAGFAPAFGRALQAGGVASENAARRAALEREEQARLQQMQLGLLEYELKNRELAATALEKQRKAQDQTEVRGQLPEHLREVYDTNPELALGLAPQFADPSKRFVTVDNQVIDRLAEGGPAMAYEVEQRLTPDQAADNQLARERFAFEQKQAAGGGTEGTAAMRLREAKINDAMQHQGLSRPEATALVDSQVSLITDPVSGRSSLVNRATGDAQPVGAGRPQIPLVGVAAGEQPVSVKEMAGEAGVLATLADWKDRTWGQLPPWVPGAAVSGERVRAGQALNRVRQQAIEAFSLSSRPPVIEQERLENMIPRAEMLESPGRAEASLNELGRTTISTRNQYAAMVNNGQLPVKQEAELLAKITELDRLALQLGVMPEQDQGQQQVPAQQVPAQQPQQQQLQQQPLAPVRHRAQSMGLSWGDVEQTAREEGMSVEQVLDALAKAGVGGG